MKLHLAALLLPAALLATACNEDAPPNRDSQNASLGPALHSPGRQSAAQPADDSISIPQGAQWTILCDAITTSDHVQRAAELKSSLIQLTGRKEFYVIHKDTESDIYFGFYKPIRDQNGAETSDYQRAHTDLNWARTLTDSRTGEPIFRMPTLSPIDAPDPDAPAEWNLANAPADAYWSLQIAAYTGGPGRKKAAVDSVRAARKLGIEAYYYHGDTVSSVCIGLWPIGAVKKQEGDSGTTDDPDQPLLITNQPLPSNISPDMVDAQGHKVKIMAPKLVILDQTLQAMINKYPWEAVDGSFHSHGKDVNGHDLLDQTFLVVVPHDKPADEVVQPAPGGTPGDLPVSPDDTVPPDPTAGALKSLGDK